MYKCYAILCIAAATAAFQSVPTVCWHRKEDSCVHLKVLEASVTECYSHLLATRHEVGFDSNSIIQLVHLVTADQWPRGLRHELSSLARKLGSWVRIPSHDMDVCVRLFCVYVVLCAGSGLATG
jgi:hypothetical protein